jgi:hypothetical protein
LNEKSKIGVRLFQSVEEQLAEDGGLDGVDIELRTGVDDERLVVAVTDGDGQSNQVAAVTRRGSSGAVISLS